MPLRLFRVSSWRNGTVLQSLYFAALPSVFLLTALYLQTGLGVSAVVAGMVTIGFALMSALASWYSGKLVLRFGRSLVIFGLIVVLVGIGGLVVIARYGSDEATPWLMAGVLVVAGLGGGCVISPNQTLTLAEIPPAEGGLAGSVGQLGQRVGNAIGAGVALSLFYSTVLAGQVTGGDTAVYHDAYGTGLLSAALFVAAALAIAFVDLAGRRRGERAGTIEA